MKKELLLSVALLIISLGLLVAADMHNSSPLEKKCSIPTKRYHKTGVDNNTTPWHFLTEGRLKFAAV